MPKLWMIEQNNEVYNVRASYSLRLQSEYNKIALRIYSYISMDIVYLSAGSKVQTKTHNKDSTAIMHMINGKGANS